MSDDRDPLEEELARFRPQPLSPELRQRIGNALAGDWRLKRRDLVGVLIAAAAACLLWLLLPPTPPPRAIGNVFLKMAPTPTAEPPPSFAAYHQALNQSPEAFEELVDRQAASGCRGEIARINPITVRQNEALWQ